MRFEKQVRVQLDKVIARDGYVCVSDFADWCVKGLMGPDDLLMPEEIWPERRQVEAVLKAAFEHFVSEALEDEDAESLDDIFFPDTDGKFTEYVFKKGDENGQRLAEAHHKEHA